MSVVIGGVTYRHVKGGLVVDAQADPQENLTDGQIYAVEGGSPLLLAEYPSGVPVASVSTSGLGFTPDLYVAFPDGPAPEGFIDWPDDSIPPQPISATAAELADWLRSDIALEAASAQLESAPRVLVWDSVSSSWPAGSSFPVIWNSTADEAATPPPGKVGDLWYRLVSA